MSNIKKGDVCKVVNCLCGHGFALGDIVTIIDVGHYDYKAQGKDGNYWFVQEKEIEPATPMEIAATLTTKKVDEQGDPFKQQVGGDHYKSMAIQPVEFILANGLGFCEGNVIKYICRYKQKGGIQDLKKVVHYAELLIKQLEENQ